MSRLVKAPPGHKLEGMGGFIPPHTPCPFFKRCIQDLSGLERVGFTLYCPAGHAGLKHETYFSCAVARGWDLGEGEGEEGGTPQSEATPQIEAQSEGEGEQ